MKERERELCKKKKRMEGGTEGERERGREEQREKRYKSLHFIKYVENVTGVDYLLL